MKGQIHVEYGIVGSYGFYLGYMALLLVSNLPQEATAETMHGDEDLDCLVVLNLSRKLYC